MTNESHHTDPVRRDSVGAPLETIVSAAEETTDYSASSPAASPSRKGVKARRRARGQSKSPRKSPPASPKAPGAFQLDGGVPLRLSAANAEARLVAAPLVPSPGPANRLEGARAGGGVARTVLRKVAGGADGPSASSSDESSSGSAASGDGSSSGGSSSSTSSEEEDHQDENEDEDEDSETDSDSESSVDPNELNSEMLSLLEVSRI